ncbi:dipicolinate synthase subunit B [Candidatus Arthromitus sp. SFB-turkey]|mgnify:FL=1|uniref:dipicolinate synthase subunit B n=1 Tax=Candidatus Arthromitus sp. SFB-turkey TaxID=1840217 RepID=UPI0007F5328A|nr:dipicolinate synthase subunit B [Candidatus Arthromitus sp. SFB-turkey]OAT88020.1 dipicolinate synthase subunit B [Candidatus Arthromitus sp. SFB-turkey]
MQNLKGLKIGYALTGSFCTFSESFKLIEKLLELNVEIFPIISFNVQSIKNRFITPEKTLEFLESKTKNPIIKTIEQAESIGPKNFLDLLLVAPCTSNTLGKFANGINDTPVTMAMKSFLRSQNKPLVIALSSNDSLGLTLKNIATLINTKNIYFSPMVQDDICKKPNSLVANYSKIIDTMLNALNNNQIRPIITI